MATLSPGRKHRLWTAALRGALLHAHARSNKLISGKKCAQICQEQKMPKPYCRLQIFTPLVPSLVSHLISSNQKKNPKNPQNRRSEDESEKKSRQRTGWEGRVRNLFRVICVNLKELLSVIGEGGVGGIFGII